MSEAADAEVRADRKAGSLHGSAPRSTPSTGLAAELALDDEAFDARYRAVRRGMVTAARRRPWTLAADRACALLETGLLGARARRPLDAPVFVTGCYRSGTTLLERLLGSHPALASFDYLGYSFPTAPLVSGALRRLSGAGAQPTLAPDQPNMQVRSTTPTECETIWMLCRRHIWSDAASHVLDADYRDPRFERTYVATVNKLLLRERRPRFMNKNPLCTLRVGYLARLFPDARFVHLFRHPWRVVRSQLDLERLWARVLLPIDAQRDWARTFVDAFMPPRRRFPRTARWREIEAVRAEDPALAVALSVVDFEQAFDRAVEAGGLHERVLRVRYEDLLADGTATLRRIFRHAGLEDPAAEAIARRAGREEVDRSLPSSTSPLPALGAPAEAALAGLVRAGSYATDEPAGERGEAP